MLSGELVVWLLDGYLPALNIGKVMVNILMGNRKLLGRKRNGGGGAEEKCES